MEYGTCLPGSHPPSQNLKIRTDTQVQRLIFEGTRATGVVYKDKNGVSKIVEAKKEIILSAGAVGSPHLLMLSGVGPAHHLQKNGVNLVKTYLALAKT